MLTCVLCNQKIFGWSHNAEPLAVGRCCDICNDTKVIPTRIQMFVNLKEKTQNDNSQTQTKI